MNSRKKIFMISSSGGHYEQLKNLAPLDEYHKLYWITEKTDYKSNSDYTLIQTGSEDKLFIPKMIINATKSFYLFLIHRPDYIISTGAMVSIPFIFIAKMFKKKVIFIETYARVYGGTKTGRLAYKYADLFIIQWESLKEIYPNAIYGGSIY